jgi:VWFA-related protein
VQPATSTAAFTSSTQLVIEKVVVKDKSGKPIEGLHKEDFTVTEDGKPQTIKFFDFENIDNVTAAQPPLPAPGILPELTQTQIAPEPPGDVRYKDRRLLALYFDMSAMSVLDQLHALDAAQHFIRTQMSPADLMAIIEYNGAQVQVLHR